MNLLKKIAAIVLVLTLCICGFKPSVPVVLADGLDTAQKQYDTTLSIKSVSKSGTNARFFANACNYIQPDATYWKSRLFGQAKVNGSEQTIQICYLLADCYEILMPDSGITPVEGMTITLSGAYESDQVNYYVEIEEVAFLYSNQTWTIKETVKAFECGSLSLHGNSSDGDEQGATQVWLIPKNPISLEMYQAFTPIIGEGFFKVNGTEVKADLYGGALEPAFCLKLEETVQPGDLLSIAGKFAIADETYVIHIEETTFKYLGMTEGKGYWTVAQQHEIYDYPKVNTVTLVEPSGYNSTYPGYAFYLKLDAELSLTMEEKESKVIGIQYAIDDGEKKTLNEAFMQTHAGGTFFALIRTDKIVKNTKITFSGIGSLSANEEKGFVLEKDVSIYINSHGISLDGYMLPQESEILGDVNGDQKVDICDVMRMKRYLAGDITINSQANLTKNDLDIDNEDLTMMYFVLMTEYNESGNPIGMPRYLDTRQIEMAAYMGPRSASKVRYENGVSQGEIGTSFLNEKEFQKYKDAGFTYLIAEGDASYYSDNLPTYMELADKVGLDVVLMDYNINNYLKGVEDINPTDITVKTQYAIDAYGQTFKGWMLADEPGIGYLDNYTAVVNSIRSVTKDKYLMMACLPKHAEIDLLTTDSQIIESNEKSLAYTNYLTSFGTLLGEFNYDLYPLVGEKNLRDDWLENLSLAASGGKENGFLNGITIQSSDFYNSYGLKFRAPIEEDDIGFQVYTALAYGMRKINYYTYWSHYSQSPTGYQTQTMVMYPTDGSGESVETDIYYAVQKVNQEIKQYDHVLMNYAWEGSITLGGADDKALGYSNDRLVASTATTNAVIGCMKDALGYDGYMIANANNPYKDIETTVSVTFKDATQAIVYVDGKEELIDLNNGTYETTIPSGEGVFIIPIV